MLFRKIGMYGVMKDKKMEYGYNIGMIKALGRKNLSNHVMMQKGFCVMVNVTT